MTTRLNHCGPCPFCPTLANDHHNILFTLQGVTEEMLIRLFRKLPGMEYCDLKKERATGKSKVRSE